MCMYLLQKGYFISQFINGLTSSVTPRLNPQSDNMASMALRIKNVMQPTRISFSLEFNAFSPIFRGILFFWGSP